MHDDGAFCFGPRDKADNLLNVARYAAQWPLIPLAELHASSVQHLRDLNMRWLLHTRRVKCLPPALLHNLLSKMRFRRALGLEIVTLLFGVASFAWTICARNVRACLPWRWPMHSLEVGIVLF